MSPGETKLEGLRYPSKYKAVPNVGEELFILGWNLISDVVHELREKGWHQDQKGKKKLAGQYYQAANIYFYLIHYGIIIRNIVQREDSTCLEFTGNKIDCVEQRLPCLSKEYGTDYVSFWEKLVTLYGIDRQVENCNDCCLGISQMIVNEKDDCISFIVGGCDENLPPEPPYGEFEPCEFVPEEFTQSIGVDFNACE